MIILSIIFNGRMTLPGMMTMIKNISITIKTLGKPMKIILFGTLLESRSQERMYRIGEDDYRRRFP